MWRMWNAGHVICTFFKRNVATDGRKKNTQTRLDTRIWPLLDILKAYRFQIFDFENDDGYKNC